MPRTACRRQWTSSTTEPSGSGGPTDLLTVGRVTKAHGLGGEVVVHLWTDVVERLAPGSVLSSDRGPLQVVSSRPLGGQRDRYLVGFEGVGDRVAAERLQGVDLSAEPVEVPGTLWVHELVGALVLDVASGAELGRVSAVEANPASDLLVLESGVLIPARFVVRVGEAAGAE
ncbi:MAG TPA: ribosome maturation factor RimM, partial [Acidimicrobiales bacterium]